MTVDFYRFAPSLILAWLSTQCLFWSISLIVAGKMRGSLPISMGGWTFIITALYFGVAAVSFGVNIDMRLILLSELILLLDATTKTVLSVYFVIRRGPNIT